MDALIHEMLKKEKIAVVRVQVRENASVRFCALLPSLPTENSEEDAQPGFYLIVLPYADDVRDLDAIMEAGGFYASLRREEQSISETLTQKEKDAAKLLIQNMTINFDSRNFENPTIQKFYSGL
jgi:hypothetical protein